MLHKMTMLYTLGHGNTHCAADTLRNGVSQGGFWPRNSGLGFVLRDRFPYDPRGRNIRGGEG